MLRVLLCDDARAFAILFSHWLREDGDIEVVATADDPDSARARAAEHQPDVIVLDHILGALTSDQVVPSLREAAPGAGILLISGMDGDTLEQAAADSRADGFVSKASGPEQMRAAVRAAALGPSAG